MEDKLEKLQLSAQKIKDKDFKILFFLIESEFPSGAVTEIYKTVKILKQNGYNALIMTENESYKIPHYLDDDLQILPHIYSVKTDGTKMNHPISPEDFLVIPEVFVNVMEQSKDLPATKIMLLQNFDIFLKGIAPGIDLSHFNIFNVVTTNDNLKNTFEEYFGKYDSKVCKLGIPDYFKPSKNPKKLVVNYVARNSDEFMRFFKLFCAKYPQFRFVSFESAFGESATGIKREEVAKRLGESACTIWLDRRASFGTLPLEAMKSGSVPIGLVPDIEPEYMVDYAGLWTNDFYKLPELLSNFVLMFMNDTIPTEITNTMKNIVSQYGDKESEVNILNTYEYFFDKRFNELTKAVESASVTVVSEPVMSIS